MRKKQMEAIICYSHSDRDLLDQLHEHLATLQRQGLLNTWCDREILPGSVIDDVIESKLEAVHVYLLLVSSAFIHSRYCFELEFAAALKRWKAGEAIIVPIIVRECDWEIPELKQFKALPEDGRPVISRHWHTADEAFKDVAAGLRKLIENSGIPSTAPIAKTRRARTKFSPDERHVSEEQRTSLRKLGNEIVERLTAKAVSASDDELRKKQGKFFGIVWSQFNEQFGTTEHGLASLPRERFDDAKNWLQQYRASKDRNFKRSNPQKYRNTLTKTIHTIAGKLGWPKDQLHIFASEKLNYPRPITSLTDLGNRQLELVRDRIRYESTKRTATVGQARARRPRPPSKHIVVDLRDTEANKQIAYEREQAAQGKAVHLPRANRPINEYYNEFRDFIHTGEAMLARLKENREPVPTENEMQQWCLQLGNLAMCCASVSECELVRTGLRNEDYEAALINSIGSPIEHYERISTLLGKLEAAKRIARRIHDEDKT